DPGVRPRHPRPPGRRRGRHGRGGLRRHPRRGPGRRAAQRRRRGLGPGLRRGRGGGVRGHGRARRRRHRRPHDRARPRRGVGPAPGPPHRPAQPREGGGPALRRDARRRPPAGRGDGVRDPQGLPAAGGRHARRVAAGARGDGAGRDGAAARRRRRGGVVRGVRVRDRRRRAARRVQGGPGEQGHGPRRGALAVHAAPELLRRRLRLVGRPRRVRGPPAGPARRRRAAADDVPAGVGDGQGAHGARDVGAPGVRRVRAPHLGVPATAPGQPPGPRHV
ncbi:MAG: FIG005069: Hypothetical protein, partial [uncultured Actinomycetospora sp.]